MAQEPNIHSEVKAEGGSLLQLAAIVEESHDAIIGKTLAGIVTSWNGGAHKMTGYSPEEVIGKSMVNLFPPELKDELPRLLEKVGRGEIIADYDSVWLRKDGTRADVEFSLSPVHTENGTVIGVSLVGHDITERKRNEIRIQRVARLYEALSKCNRAVVHSANQNELFQLICDTAVRFGSVTMAWVGLLDETSRQVKPVASSGSGIEYLNDIKISINADDPFGRGPSGTAIRENHPTWSQDFQHDPTTAPWHEKAKDFDWRSSAALPLLKNGVPIGSLTLCSDIINAFDDDAQKLLIEMASDISFALDNFAKEESLRQTQLIVDSSQDGIFGVSLEGIVLSWSGGAEKMTGYSPEEIVGKSSMILFSPEKKEEWPIFIDKIKRKDYILNYDTIVLRKDGSKVDVSVSISPILAKDGSVIGSSVISRDISERKKAERHIEELNETRNKFINIISHQLRTPLTAVNWNLEAILDGDFGKLEDVTYKFLQLTHKSSTELTNRINDLLTAMDIEEGRVVFVKEEVAIDSIAAAVMNETIKRCEFKNISCEYAAPERDLAAIEGDGEKIRTAITKLMENAAIYTKDGGKIIAKLETIDDTIRFEVKDTGIGVPAPEQHRLFTRFFRASNASVMQPDAFGLGLFITKSFIEQHGGKVGFESKEGEGSMFWFEVPTKPIRP